MLEDVGHLADPLDEDEAAQLAEGVVEGVEDGEEEDAGAADGGRDVAEDVDLGAPRALRPVAQAQRHAARLERGAHRSAHVDDPPPAPPALLMAERRDPALQLGDCAVDRGQVLRRAGRQRPVELRQRPRGRQLAGSLDRGPLELAAQVLLEAAHLVGVERRQLLALGTPAARLQSEAPADPLYVDPDHAGALATPPEGGDREPGQVAHLAVGSRGDRLADRLAQLLQVEPLGALVALLLDPLLERLRLGGAEEVALEQQLEDPPVLLGLGDRGCERLAEVALVRPADLVERLKGVEDLRGADRHPLGAKVLEEGEKASRRGRTRP